MKLLTSTIFLSMSLLHSLASADSLRQLQLDLDPFCTLQEDFDFDGQNIGTARAGNPGDCCDICYNREGCNAFSWNDYNGGTCWLKSEQGAVSYRPGVISALSVQFLEPTCVSEHDVDYVGNDIGSAFRSDPSDCCSACEAFPGCRAFTHTDYGGGICWFKSSKGSTISSPGAVSAEPYPKPFGETPAPTQPSCTIEQGVDYTGNNLNPVRGANAEACCTRCREVPGCGAFSWNSYNGGTCWLKTARGQTTTNSDVISGTI